MKLSKKVLAVLVSMNFLFSSIAFGTGTSKLEPVYLANVAQYMPMAEKIKLEHVSKHCAESLGMGYADDFLKCYKLLQTEVRKPASRPVIRSFLDYKLLRNAFHNSIKICFLKNDIEFTPEFKEFKILYTTICGNPIIILPRAHNTSNDYEQQCDFANLSELLNKLRKFETWLLKNDYIKECRDCEHSEGLIDYLKEYFSLNCTSIIDSCTECKDEKCRKYLAELFFDRKYYNEKQTYSSFWNKYQPSPDATLFDIMHLDTIARFRLTELLSDATVPAEKNLKYISDYNKCQNCTDANLFCKLIQQMGAPDFNKYNLLSLRQRCKNWLVSRNISEPVSAVLSDVILCHNFGQTNEMINFEDFKKGFGILESITSPDDRLVHKNSDEYLPVLDLSYVADSFSCGVYKKLWKIRTSFEAFLGSPLGTYYRNFVYDRQTRNYVFNEISPDRLKITLYLLSKSGCDTITLRDIENTIKQDVGNNQSELNIITQIFDSARNRIGEFSGIPEWSQGPMRFDWIKFFPYVCYGSLVALGASMSAIYYRTIYKNNNKNNKNINKKILRNNNS